MCVWHSFWVNLFLSNSLFNYPKNSLNSRWNKAFQTEAELRLINHVIVIFKMKNIYEGFQDSTREENLIRNTTAKKHRCEKLSWNLSWKLAVSLINNKLSPICTPKESAVYYKPISTLFFNRSKFMWSIILKMILKNSSVLKQ